MGHKGLRVSNILGHDGMEWIAWCPIQSLVRNLCRFLIPVDGGGDGGCFTDHTASSLLPNSQRESQFGPLPKEPDGELGR